MKTNHHKHKHHHPLLTATAACATATAAAATCALPTLPAHAQQAPLAPPKYNVVFIISDQHKLAVTGCYGDPVVKTPNIDALAADGVKFTRIYTPSPLSAPARAALMTGVYPADNDVLLHRMLIEKNGKQTETEAGKHRLPGYKLNLETWGEYMKAQGFGTAAIGKMHVHGELQKGVDPAYPDGNLMGFDVSNLRFYTSFPGGQYKEWKGSPDYYNRYREIGEYVSYFKGNNFNQNLKPTLVKKEEDIFDFAVASKSIEYIKTMAAQNKPFFIHVGLEKPHKPWTTEQRFYDLYKTSQMQLPKTAYDWHDNGRYPYVKKGTHAALFDPGAPVDENKVKTSMRAYYGCVSEMDTAVGEIVAAVKAAGVYDKTIFIYTTDHGEHLYQHGMHEKHNMFEEAVNIPFIISCPALLPKGATCNSLGSMLDVLPTISELLGYQPLKQWEGRSLVGQITAKKPWQDRVIYSEFYENGFTPWESKYTPLRMRLDSKYKYVYSHGYIDQLFDTAADPDEMHNLALDKTGKYTALIERDRFLTLQNWRFWLLPQMTCQAKDGALTWQSLPEAKNYTLWRSATPDATAAVKVTDTKDPAYKPPEPGGYWWVTANWNLTRKGERKENVPMITAAYPKALPVTPMMKL